MHHAHKGKILEAPIFYAYSKVNHSVPGVNMQEERTLQDRQAVMLPLDTDLRSAFIRPKKEAELRSVSDLQLTQHVSPGLDERRD